MFAPEWGSIRSLLGLAGQESLGKEVHAFVAIAFGYEPVRLKFGSGKVARRNWSSNLPTGLTLIHGRGMTRHKPKAKRRARDPASGDAWGPCKRGAVLNSSAVPLQAQAYNRASGEARSPY